ncbi:MAG: hypothetical protein E7369_03205 [Clostridiales bacterium]|nr:hypothetical protein [Clostridiales bacterium]
MFVTSNQIFVFFSCVTIGGGCGVIFTLFYFIKTLFKNNRVIDIAFDLLSFCATAVIYVLWSHAWGFPNVRAYMIAGVFVGIILYMKSFHIILAKFVKRLYTISIRIFRKGREGTKNGSSQTKKVNSRRCRRGGAASVDTRNSYVLPVDSDRGGFKSQGGT